MTELVTHAAAVVQRYGGTVDKFTGDGIMAVFGAPAALEDHALRACLAALGIQEEVAGLAAEVDRRDGVDLRLRVGLNSGQVIAGEIGSAALGYTAIGEQVGMAQRMESVAPPGGGDAQRLHCAAGRGRCGAGGAAAGAHQGRRGRGAGAAAAERCRPTDRCLGIRRWWAATGNWPRWPRCWTARPADAGPWLRWSALPASARPG